MKYAVIDLEFCKVPKGYKEETVHLSFSIADLFAGIVLA